jgi:hypothetical protein
MHCFYTVLILLLPKYYISVAQVLHKCYTLHNYPQRVVLQPSGGGGDGGGDGVGGGDSSGDGSGDGAYGGAYRGVGGYDGVHSSDYGNGDTGNTRGGGGRILNAADATEEGSVERSLNAAGNAAELMSGEQVRELERMLETSYNRFTTIVTPL